MILLFYYFIIAQIQYLTLMNAGKLKWTSLVKSDSSGAVTGQESVEVPPSCVHAETILALTTIWHP